MINMEYTVLSASNRPSETDFAAFYRILALGLPEDERRSFQGQQALLDDPHYRLVLGYEDGKVRVGFAWWEIDGWLYGEHLAVEPELRNGGIGSRVVEKFVKAPGMPVVFEVEPEGATKMASRRIGLYRRLGFVLNDYDYLQPPLNKGDAPCVLKLMSSAPLSPAEFIRVRELLYRVVYHTTVEELCN